MPITIVLMYIFVKVTEVVQISARQINLYNRQHNETNRKADANRRRTTKQTGDEAELWDTGEPCATKYHVHAVYNIWNDSEVGYNLHDLYSAKVLDKSGRVDEDILCKVGIGKLKCWLKIIKHNDRTNEWYKCRIKGVIS